MWRSENYLLKKTSTKDIPPDPGFDIICHVMQLQTTPLPTIPQFYSGNISDLTVNKKKIWNLEQIRMLSRVNLTRNEIMVEVKRGCSFAWGSTPPHFHEKLTERLETGLQFSNKRQVDPLDQLIKQTYKPGTTKMCGTINLTLPLPFSHKLFVLVMMKHPKSTLTTSPLQRAVYSSVIPNGENVPCCRVCQILEHFNMACTMVPEPARKRSKANPVTYHATFKVRRPRALKKVIQ